MAGKAFLKNKIKEIKFMNKKGHFRFRLSTFSAWELIKFIVFISIAVPIFLIEKAIEFFHNKLKRR